MLLRFIAFLVATWVILRLVRAFFSPGRPTAQRPKPQQGKPPKGKKRWQDEFSRENIQDAEFEDVTPPPKDPAAPPKPS